MSPCLRPSVRAANCFRRCIGQARFQLVICSTASIGSRVRQSNAIRHCMCPTASRILSLVVSSIALRLSDCSMIFNKTIALAGSLFFFLFFFPRCMSCDEFSTPGQHGSPAPGARQLEFYDLHELWNQASSRNSSGIWSIAITPLNSFLEV
ncbi:hypothetical protein BDW75DRAFT_16874 [Aspergillus navahoensis]